MDVTRELLYQRLAFFSFVVHGGLHKTAKGPRGKAPEFRRFRRERTG
jgi:hypothetical protein